MIGFSDAINWRQFSVQKCFQFSFVKTINIHLLQIDDGGGAGKSLISFVN